MGLKKVSRAEKGAAVNGQGAAVLQPSYIKDATESNLVARMVAISHALEELPTGVGTPLHPSFIAELAHRLHVNHPTADVQLITATNLAEAVRVAAVGVSSAAAAAALPLPAPVITDVVTLWIRSILRLRNTDEATVVEYITHLMNTLAATHALAGLLPKAQVPETVITTLYETLLTHVPPAATDTMIAVITTVIADCITATGGVTDAQMQLLMLAVAQQQAHPKPYVIAVGVLRQHERLLYHHVADFVIASFTNAVEVLHRIDVQGDADTSERRNAVKKIAAVAGLVKDCAAASIHLVQELIPGFLRLLDAVDAVEARVSIVDGAGKAFLLCPALATEHMSSYMSLVGMVRDAKPAVRLHALQFVCEMLLQRCDSSTHWSHLGPSIKDRLVDADEAVRRAAVQATCALADRALARIPKGLLETCGARCIDRRPAVRAFSIVQLAKLYRTHRLTENGEKVAWIPAVILRSVHLEGNLPFVEAALADLLPNPAIHTNTESPNKTVKKGSAKVPTVAVFDFESESHSAATGRFSGAFIVMCQDILAAGAEAAADCFTTLWTLFAKRTELRLTVMRLMQLRCEAKTPGISKAELAVKKEHIDRLLQFVNARTYARTDPRLGAGKGDPWVELLTIRDEKAVKALIALGQPECEDLGAALAQATRIIKASVSKDVAAFFENKVAPRLAFPISTLHVEDVVKELAAARGSTERASRLLPAAHALSLLAQAAPHLVARRIGDVVSFVIQDSKSYTEEAQDEALTLLLRVLVSSHRLQDGKVKLPATMRESDAISALGRICLSSRTPRLAKCAARSLVELFPGTTKAYADLLAILSRRVAEAADGPAEKFGDHLAGVIKTVQVLAESCSDQIVAPCEAELLSGIHSILLLAMRHAGPGDSAVARSSRGATVANPKSSYHVLVDVCAKAMYAFTARHLADGSRRSLAVQEAAKVFFTAFADAKELGTQTVGSTLKRLALLKQMIKLLRRPDLSIPEQLRISMYVSAEHNAHNRGVLQERLCALIRKDKGRCDMAVFATLCMTALSEETRSGFNALKQLVQSAAEKLRKLIGDSVDLSKPESLLVCPEYCIPYVVIAFAHHGFYKSEMASHFTSFQRVWHLLFDELTRGNIHKVSFLQDLLRKLRLHDDALAPDLDNTRVICDLALKVLMASLSLKSVGVDALKPYPGTVLLPCYFKKPQHERPPDKVYLPEHIIITPQAVLRVPTASKRTADNDAEVEGSAADDDDDDSLVLATQGTGGRLLDEALTPEKAQRSVSRSAARSGGRGKSARSQTPPPSRSIVTDVQSIVPRAVTPTREDTDLRNNRAAATPTRHPESSDQETLHAKLAAVVHDICRGKKEAEILAISWGTIAAAISSALNIKVTADLRKPIYSLLVSEVNALK